MRTRSAVPVLFAAVAGLALVGCSGDSTVIAPDLGAPTATTSMSAGNSHANNESRSIHIVGVLTATEAGTPQPGTPIVVRHLEGEGTASHLGRFTVVGDFTLNLATASGGGTTTYTAANGDILTATTTGQAVVGQGTAVVTETVTITGGTGRFEGATGTLTVVRRIVQATGVSTGTMDGTITIPK